MTGISVHEATVNTVAVTIRTLTIGRRQVTLAVFRQLLERNLIGDGGVLLGNPWGTVNYHPSKVCEHLGQHLHVVWQLGDELRRGTVEEPRLLAVEPDPESVRFWFDALILAGWTPEGVTPDEMRYGHRRFRVTVAPDLPPLAVDCADLNPEARSLPGDRQSSSPYCVEMVASHEQAIRDRLAAAGGPTVKDLHGMVAAEMRADRDLQANLAARWQELAALPQLFIAV